MALGFHGQNLNSPKRSLSGRNEIENRSASDPAGNSSVQTGILRRSVVTALMFGVVALALFWAGIGNPRVKIYVQGNYVPAAEAFLIDAPNTNPEAPPLGKLLIAVAIKARGQSPWRLRSRFRLWRPDARCHRWRLVA